MPSSHTGYQIRSAAADRFAAAPVKEHHVEITERTELGPPVAAHRDQGQTPGVALGGLVEQFGQPLVGGLGIGPAERVAVQVGTLDEALASGAQGHGRTVPPGRSGRAHGHGEGDVRRRAGTINLWVWPMIERSRGSASSTVC